MREAGVGSIAMRAVEEWLTSPEVAHKDYATGLAHFALKHGISKTGLGRARAVASGAPDLGARLARDELTLHAAYKAWRARKKGVVAGEPAGPRIEVIEQRLAQLADAVDRGNHEWQLINARLQNLRVDATGTGGLSKMIDKVAENYKALEKRLERDERDGATLQGFVNAALARLDSATQRAGGKASAERMADMAAAILRLEKRLDGDAAPAEPPPAKRPPEYPRGWAHMKEEHRDAWRNGRASAAQTKSGKNAQAKSH